VARHPGDSPITKVGKGGDGVGVPVGTTTDRDSPPRTVSDWMVNQEPCPAFPRLKDNHMRTNLATASSP
jgi:hypothetical protein